MSAVLELKGISYTAEDSGKEILKNVSFEVEENTFVVITGPNGGGKSSLAKVIMGIVEPTAGSVIYDGEDITSLSVTERAKKGVSFAFQQPVRFKGIKVADLISLAANRPLEHWEVCDYLSAVGLCANDYVNREVDGSLSGGEMKRIEIAMSIVRGAPLALFDEPEAGIDLWSFQNLIQVFRKMHDEFNGAIVIISHQERILEIADKIIVLGDGEIKAQGTRDEILPTLLSGQDISKFCPVNKA